jgi:hypothetical protein
MEVARIISSLLLISTAALKKQNFNVSFYNWPLSCTSIKHNKQSLSLISLAVALVIEEEG